MTTNKSQPLTWIVDDYAQQQIVDHIAHALVGTCSAETLADVIDALLCCDAEESLTDDQADCGEQLFDKLTAIAPKAMTILEQRLNG